PLPIRSHVGSWISVDSRLLVDASDARVVVIGADGGTRNLLSSFDKGRVVARFAPDRSGSFTVQVVADVEGGPRPVLEARVDADVSASTNAAIDPMPGEATCTEGDADVRSTCILQSIRGSFRVPDLARDARLDRVAVAHARAMMRANDVAHDAGDGDPTRRFEDAGLRPKIVGENVAHAESAVAAMRSLWASPSHRANTVSTELDRYGLAAVTAPDGSVWVALELAGALR
ncbi:MAG TPA: CAP domain-containing protein, partial [Polyangiaceae bacterium]